MKPVSAAAIVLAIASGLVACTTGRPAAAARPDPALQAEIESFMAKYVAAYESGRVDALAPFYDENSMIWASKRVAVFGWPEVRAMFAGTFEKYEIDAAVHVQEVRGYGDEAFVRFLTEVRLVPKQGGDPVNAYYRDVAVLRQSGGTWKIARNMDQPVTAELLQADLRRSQPR